MTEYRHNSQDVLWSRDEAHTLATIVEHAIKDLGAHVALTGGCLYKVGLRDDLDLLFYRVRQAPVLQEREIIGKLQELGFTEPKHYGWVYESTYQGKNVDLFFPENYPNGTAYVIGY